MFFFFISPCSQHLHLPKKFIVFGLLTASTSHRVRTKQPKKFIALEQLKMLLSKRNPEIAPGHHSHHEHDQHLNSRFRIYVKSVVINLANVKIMEHDM